MEEDYQTWESVDLLKLLRIMDEEECPTGHFSKKFDEIVRNDSGEAGHRAEGGQVVGKKKKRAKKSREREKKRGGG